MYSLYIYMDIPLDDMWFLMIRIIALGAPCTVGMGRDLVEFAGVIHNGKRLVVRFKNLLGQMFT